MSGKVHLLIMASTGIHLRSPSFLHSTRILRCARPQWHSWCLMIRWTPVSRRPKNLKPGTSPPTKCGDAPRNGCVSRAGHRENRSNVQGTIKLYPPPSLPLTNAFVYTSFVSHSRFCVGPSSYHFDGVRP